MSYVSGSGDFTGKQIPKALPASAFGSSVLATQMVIHKHTDSVTIVPKFSGSLFFLYNTTGSEGDTLDAGSSGNLMTHLHGWNETYANMSASYAPTTLPISVCAWSASGNIAKAVETSGSIIFNYKGGL